MSDYLTLVTGAPMNDDEIKIDIDDEAMISWLGTEEGKHVEKMMSNLLNGFLYFWLLYRRGESGRPNERHEETCASYSEVCALMNVVVETLHEAIETMDKPVADTKKPSMGILRKVLN
jgi:hypothetical protein